MNISDIEAFAKDRASEMGLYFIDRSQFSDDGIIAPVRDIRMKKKSSIEDYAAASAALCMLPYEFEIFKDDETIKERILSRLKICKEDINKKMAERNLP